MQHRSPSSLIFASLLFLSVLLAACTRPPAGNSAPLLSRRPADLIRITADPILQDPATAALCVAPGMRLGPHAAPAVHIYANETAIAYRRANPAAINYPVGAIFWKEKYAAPGASPDLATVMTKTADTGAVEDWKFTMVELPSMREIDLGVGNTIVDCMVCHRDFLKNGYVSNVGESALVEMQKR